MNRSTPSSRRSFIGRVTLGAAALSLFPRLSFGAAEEKKKLGVALVGLGGYSRGELGPALKQTEHCRLAGVVTGSESKGKKWAKEYGFSEKSVYNYDTMHRLADDPAIDIVYVVTPVGLHAEHVMKAAAAGKHVICEKPMAGTVRECEAMIEACRKAERQLAIGYRLHFDPYHQELMRVVQTQELGEFKRIEGALGFPLGGGWRATKALGGGGPMMDVGIYPLHASFMAANSDVVAVTAKEHKKTRPDVFKDVEEAIEWDLEFANGAKAHGFTTYADNVDGFRAESDKGFFELNPAYFYRGMKGSTSKGKLSFPPANQQARHMDAIAHALIKDEPVPTPGALGLRDIRVIEAIYASAARDGRRIEL